MNLEHYIDGRHVPSVSGATFTTLSPTTNRPGHTVCAGDRDDVDAAVAAALKAFTHGPWPRTGHEQRAEVLRSIAAVIEARDEEIAAVECADTGLPITQARGQARRAAHNFRYFADLITTLGDATYQTSNQLNYVIRKPIGVAGLITPWNTPFMLATWKLAPALAAGCPVVLKPAEWSPASAALLPAIMEAAGLPPGVFNLVHGIGESAGHALVTHPDVPVLSFTGETTTGQTIMREAAPHLKTLSMELGGKSPLVVFADADLDAALDAAVFGVFSLNGERCTASSRVLVQDDIYEEFVARLAARAAFVKVGPPEDPATELGALIHPEHYARVLGYVRTGIEEGARLVTGGHRPPHLPSGNYLNATVFADVTPAMRVFQEEIFGPVVCVTPFSGEAQAVELANATRYGLAAYLWTRDLQRAHRLAQAIDAGMLWINSHNVRDLRTPFGGVKHSGLGREGGRHSLDLFTEPHTVHVATQDHPIPRFGTS
ncbi:5-carboxymethyl-2-hydroxymuconate semialdehyde dehydrogenase [Nonomuraea sp. NPDC050310]|uniref:5-carboxymethyl-2-hydroxymuconate semialdehyde dehydrogenase n=1 Tax=unclassified Nonomuraea TaxID=2593643 RepID=UPI0033DC2B55